MIALAGIAIRQGAFRLADVSFAVPAGGYAVLMGATGSGKTTLVEVICGLRRPDAGSVIVGGRDVTREPPGARGIGYVPQDGALFPGWQVHAQLSFALHIRGSDAAACRRRAEELAALLGLEHLLGRTPHGLSGGERQRVALGRALAHRPAVLLLDEPLSSLDEATQDQMHGLLERVHRETGTTVLHVTHSRREAERLGSLRLRLDAGRVAAAGGPG